MKYYYAGIQQVLKQVSFNHYTDTDWLQQWVTEQTNKLYLLRTSSGHSSQQVTVYHHRTLIQFVNESTNLNKKVTSLRLYASKYNKRKQALQTLRILAVYLTENCIITELSMVMCCQLTCQLSLDIVITHVNCHYSCQPSLHMSTVTTNVNHHYTCQLPLHMSNVTTNVNHHYTCQMPLHMPTITTHVKSVDTNCVCIYVDLHEHKQHADHSRDPWEAHLVPKSFSRLSLILFSTSAKLLSSGTQNQPL